MFLFKIACICRMVREQEYTKLYWYIRVYGLKMFHVKFSSLTANLIKSKSYKLFWYTISCSLPNDIINITISCTLWPKSFQTRYGSKYVSFSNVLFYSNKLICIPAKCVLFKTITQYYQTKVAYIFFDKT